MKLLYKVLNEDNFSTVKEILKVKFEISSRLILKLKQTHQIFLNGNICFVNAKVTTNDVIEIYIDFIDDNSNVASTKMNLNIIYEDDSYLVIDKPAGLPVHPSLNYYETSLSNGIKYYFDSIKLQKKIRPVNRLDKDTSGIVIFAKNEYIQECLIRQMKHRDFSKEYIAICEGYFKEKQGTINAPISRKEGSIIERNVNIYGDLAITHYHIIDQFNNLSIVNCKLETGRTHQIRVHLSHIGHPIIGDTLYGKSSELIGRQALHAYTVSFIHPISKELVTYTSELPTDMKKDRFIF